MSVKTKGIQALFIILVAILAIKPSLINNVYNSIIGRLILVGLVIFLSMNNVSLGLLVALAIIITTNYYSPLLEGLTVGEDNDGSKGKKIVLTKLATKSKGVDIETVKNTVRPKDSKTIPVDPSSKNSEEVSAFTTGMLGKPYLSNSSLEDSEFEMGNLMPQGVGSMNPMMVQSGMNMFKRV